LAYILGNRRLKYEKLYERRAEVLAELTRRMFEVHHNLVGILTSPSRPHDRYDKAAEAGRLCFALLDYYSSNEVWLTPETGKKVEEYLIKITQAVQSYASTPDEGGFPEGEEGQALGRKAAEDTDDLRRALLGEFREILYPPPWYEAPLRWLEWLETRVRKDRSQE
jgi:hypothetical protein